MIHLHFKKKEKNFAKEKSGLWSNINFYWELAVGIMFLVFIFALFLSFSFFTKTNTESISSTTVNSNTLKTIKKERIDKVLEYFATKAKKSDQILNSPAPVVDPSM